MSSSQKPFIPLAVPNLGGNEWNYVKDCLDTGWISSVGGYVDKFEASIAEFVGAKHAIAAQNGTAALHISLLLSNVKPGDHVIMPCITFVATANAIAYTGAEPILIDADPNTWQMDLDLLEEFLANDTEVRNDGLRYLKSSGRAIKAIMPVHVQGNIFDFDRFNKIVDKFGLLVIEDSTEALGSTYKGKHAGTFGTFGTSSFNGNKIISTGGGGMIFTNDSELARRAKHLTTTAKTDPMEYFHDEVGYNYRLVNILAAIGLAQMEQLPQFIKRKREVADFYRESLMGVGDIGFQTIKDEVEWNGWLFTISTQHQRKILATLNGNNIISRPFWAPMNTLPMYKDCLYVTKVQNCDRIHKSCLCLPCSTNITDAQMERVVEVIKSEF